MQGNGDGKAQAGEVVSLSVDLDLAEADILRALTVHVEALGDQVKPLSSPVLAFGSDPRLLAVGYEDGHADVWDAGPKPPSFRQTLAPDEQSNISALAFQPGTDRLAPPIHDSDTPRPEPKGMSIVSSTTLL